ncbi:alpha/beta hydrolase [Oligoflexus tunisiensis]|uniref:alpha/beta hydrolase n=1 Tax=Oligoflexus tunisiensis TaxID=708132 RepID=UPI001C402F65|nr:alpha/beta fold hydrolase [Oligoflexus tunisiensis]
MKKRKLGVILIWLACGCNSAFYQPDFVEYRTPRAEKLNYSDIAIPTEDGLVLHGWTIRPQNPSQGLVIHFHGNAQNMSSHMAYVTWLVRSGYTVITFDYRGYGRSPGQASRLGLIRDGKAVLRYVDKQPEFADQDIFVLAQSLGGAVAIPSLALVQPRGLCGLIVESSFASYRDMAAERLKKIWPTRPLQWPLSFLVSDDWRPMDSVAELGIPLLFIHGDQDEVVPYAEGEKLFARATSPDKEFWTIPQGGHTEAFLREDSPYRTKLLQFLREASNKRHQSLMSKASR